MIRLERIEIEGYRSIKKLALELRPLNILIGANGSGKSNFISALRLLGEIVERRLQRRIGSGGGASAFLHFGAKRTQQMRFRASFGAESGAYESVLELAADDRLSFASESVSVKGAEGHPEPVRVEIVEGAGHQESKLEDLTSRMSEYAIEPYGAMKSWAFFHFHDTSPTAAVKQKHPIGDKRTLRPDGANLASLLYSLKKRAPTNYREIVDVVGMVAPFFADFVLEPDVDNTDFILLQWRHKSDPSYFGADSLSDGTLRFMCLATMLLQPDKPSLIVVDEPELGLHPAAIEYLAALLEVASKERQVIIATQSVTLLDQFSADDVIVVEREHDESTFAHRHEADLQNWLERYSLGELWLKNVLGGRPG